jgi:hypothetical protein
VYAATPLGWFVDDVLERLARDIFVLKENAGHLPGASTTDASRRVFGFSVSHADANRQDLDSPRDVATGADLEVVADRGGGGGDLAERPAVVSGSGCARSYERSPATALAGPRKRPAPRRPLRKRQRNATHRE